jgi:hypothetical protein
MSSRTAAWLAWSIWALCLPLVAFSGILGFLSAPAQTRLDSGLVLLFTMLLLTFPTVGAVIASRRPENSIGWIFCAAGLVCGVAYSASMYADYALGVSARPLPGVQYAAWVSTWALFPALLLTATMLYLLLPDGRLPSPPVLWRPVAWTAVIGSLMAALGAALGATTDYPSVASPLAVEGALGNIVEMLGGFGWAFMSLGCVTSMASPFIRLHRARGQERQQLKWFAYATALTATCFILVYVVPESSAFGSPGWVLGTAAWYLMWIGISVLPIAAAIAILRYRLYDIDRIINRTLVYGLLTALLAAGYFGSILLLERIGSLVFNVSLPRPYWSGHSASQRRRDPSYGSAVQPSEASHPGLYRPQLLPP